MQKIPPKKTKAKNEKRTKKKFDNPEKKFDNPDLKSLSQSRKTFIEIKTLTYLLVQSC